jgi:excisionase family DNA binding protein
MSRSTAPALITTYRAQRLLGLRSTRTIRNMIADGRLKAVRIDGRYRLRERDVLRLAKRAGR